MRIGRRIVKLGRDRRGRFVVGCTPGPGRGHRSFDRQIEFDRDRILESLGDAVVAYIGEEAFDDRFHGDVADLDCRLASALATAFASGWTGVVLAAAAVVDGRLVRASVKAVNSGRVDGLTIEFLRALGMGDVGDALPSESADRG